MYERIKDEEVIWIQASTHPELTLSGTHIPSYDAIYLETTTPFRTVDRRHYCVECGIVLERGARTVYYFIDRLSEVQHMLRARSRRLGTRDLTEVELRLIVKTMERDQLFADPYGSTFETQAKRFVDMLAYHRPDVPRSMFDTIVQASA
ncbi:MAG: hypothetical protein U9R75_00565 [Candidatus Thermoplasmatota archaeon]|nr:hypothetical protein [Candidatus Thermoplasmatota archaeon]